MAFSCARIAVMFLALSAQVLSGSQGQAVQSHHFDFTPGDVLVIENDYGRVRVEAWDKPEIEVTSRVIAADPERLKSVAVVCSKVGSRVFAQSYFYGYSAESVLFDVKAPGKLNLIAGGANTAVEVIGLGGFVRVQSLTGFVSVNELSGSATLFSQNGNISFAGSSQPVGDLHLESVTGNVECSFGADLNLRAWLRAGRRISWNDEMTMQAGFLERQLGVGGPALLAVSGHGNVLVRTGYGGLRSTSRLDPGRPTAQEQTGVRESSRRSGSGHSPDGPSAGPVTAAEASVPDKPASDLDQSAGYALKVNVDYVYLNASVRDESTGRAVPGLLREDFEVLEDGVPQEVARFDSTEAPFSLLLLLDVSGSTKDYLGMIKRASIEFTRLIKLNDRIAIASFNSRPRLNQDFTNDRAEAMTAINRLKSGGGTAFYDALDRSLNKFMEGVEGRKAIVVFSDGVDNQLTGDFSDGSSMTFRDLYRSIEEKDTLVYTIFLDTEGNMGPGRAGSVGGILGDIIFGRGGPPGRSGPRGDPQAYAEARRQLEMIADQTGARMYSPRSAGDLTGVFEEIAQDLRVQYTLGYSSNNRVNDGKWRDLEVRVPDREGLVVRSRKGYYAGRG